MTQAYITIFNNDDDDENQAYSEYKHSMTFRVRAVAIATQPVHRLQIRPESAQ